MPLQVLFDNHEAIKRALKKNKWDFSHSGLGIVSFEANHSAVVTALEVGGDPFTGRNDSGRNDTKGGKVKVQTVTARYRWVLTKKNLLEFRSQQGKMLFTAVLLHDQLCIQELHADRLIKITVDSVKPIKQKGEVKE